MTPLHRALSRARRNVTSARLEGVNHLFQPPTDQWPIVNGVQEPTFSVEALKKIHDWVALETRQPGDPLPVTVKRPAPAARKAGKPATRAKVRS